MKIQWQHIIPGRLSLKTGQVHIWRIDLDQYFKNTAQQVLMLSRDELLRADRFYFEKDRRRFIAARSALRFLLGKYLGISSQEIVFQYEAKGKPYLDNSLDLHFNLSHADRMALIGFVLRTPIGVDIELIKTAIEFETVATHFFSAYEVKVLLNLPESQKPEGFFNAWTRKESFIKAIGDGLSFPLAKFDVSLHPQAPAQLLATHWKPDEAQYWSLETFDPAPDFKGAFAWREQVEDLLFWDLIQ